MASMIPATEIDSTMQSLDALIVTDDICGTTVLIPILAPNKLPLSIQNVRFISYIISSIN